MVVLLVILMFAVFVTIDLIRERRRVAALVQEGQTLREAIQNTEPNWVSGFLLPPQLHYHQGHTWVHWVGSDQAYVGLDDFGRRLLGTPSRVSVAAVGSHLHQGERAVKLSRDGEDVTLAAPLEGEIIAVNPRLKDDPGLLHRDAYGLGWIYKVRSPNLFREVPNLLHGSLARRWMEDVRERFQHRLMLAHGSVIQDGGAHVEDMTQGLDATTWRELVDEFVNLKPSARL
jgi:glycine cleavage system H lipoate-binding protein